MINGIDVSSWQGDSFPWPSYKGKINFAGVKVSEGLTGSDPDAARNIAGARSIGAAVIGYHFLHASLSGLAQAEHFLSCAHAAGLKPGDIIALDAEDGGLDGESPAQMDVTASTFRAELQRHFPGYNPVLYTEISMAPHLLSMAACPLWLADLDTPLMTRVGPWNLVSMWQTGQRGTDTDAFNGDAGQLARLAFR